MRFGSTHVKKLTPEGSLELWRRYKETHDVAVRNQLVLAFYPLVKYIAYKKVRELPSRCEIDDFISCGLLGLIAAIERFSDDRGTTLEQFAWTRINGAILDELRRQDWASRSLRRFERAATQSSERFCAGNGRHPTSKELAADLGITVEELRRRQSELNVAQVGSLNGAVSADEDAPVERLDTIASKDFDSQPEYSLATSEAKQRFRAEFRSLPVREREVAVLLYAQDWTLREVGQRLGVSESRVCQIHADLKYKLKRGLAADADLFTAVA